MSILTVLTAGPHSTVQDLGRPGAARSGVPRAGALDPAALAAANRAVGNPAEAAGLECVLRGPTLVTDVNLSVCLVGSGWTHGPLRLPAGVPYRIGGLPAGLRCWVAVSGGIQTVPVLDSRSTDTLSHLGGLDGGPLRDGDRLPVGPDRRWGPAPAPAPSLGEEVVTLRAMPGPHVGGTDGLVGAAFTVGTRSDRTALRLEGPSGPPPTGELRTVGVLPGVVQLPPDGLPILLLANCQTTGGYPVVAVVCGVDLRLAAQLRPGARVRFAPITVQQARDLAAQAAV